MKGKAPPPYSSCSTHEHHRRPAGSEQVLFCTVVALGQMRLVCQPRLMGVAVKNAPEASALLEAQCQQPGVQLAKPEHDCWEVFPQLLGGVSPTAAGR